MIPFGAGLSTSIAVAKDLGDEDKASWLAASYALTQGAFVLISGRFGCVVGYLIAHFGIREGYRFVVCFRGLTGMVAAFIVPNAVALIGHTFPPGRMRNVAMGLLRAMAPGKYLFLWRHSFSAVDFALPSTSLATMLTRNLQSALLGGA